MSFTSKEMLNIESEVKTNQLNSKNDGRFLSQILKSLSDGKDPVGVLELLAALWGTSAASRSDEKEALNRVGRWLESYLKTNPGIQREALALRVGWFKRFVTINEANQKQNSNPPPKVSGKQVDKKQSSGPPPRPEIQFGRELANLRSSRQKALQAAPPQPRQSTAQPQATQDTTEVWSSAFLSWSPNSQELIVSLNAKRASARQAAAQALLKSLPADAQKKINDRKELKSVRATVKPLGNTFEIVALTLA